MSMIEEQLRQYYQNREYPPDSEEYQSSLDIYLTLRSLLKSQKIDTIDVEIVDSIMSGYSFRKTAQILGIDRRSVQTRYRRILSYLEEGL
jgi:transposase-like protein